MQLKIKYFLLKLLKIKNYLKKNYFFFLIITKKKSKTIKYYNINKFITKKILNNSFYKNIKLLTIENLGFVKLNQISNFKNFTNIFRLIAIKFNKNLYNLVQLKKLKNLNYKFNINILIKFFKLFLKPILKVL